MSPTINYRLKDGTPVKGVTTINGAVLAKPALVPWGYSQGKENYDRVTKLVLGMLDMDIYKEHPEKLLEEIPRAIMSFQVGKLYDKRDSAASAGTWGHALVEADLKGWPEPDMSKVPKDIKGRAEGCYLAYREWKDRTRFKLIHSEIPLVSEKHKFGGCLDIGGGISDLELIDLKTGKGIYWSFWIQLAGYIILWDENHPENTIKGANILNIHPDGSFSHDRKISLSAEKRIFLKVNEIFQEMENLGVKL